MSRWNNLVKIKESGSKNWPVYKEQITYAEMLLRQLNTAGGEELMGRECDNFIETNKKLYES